MHEPGSQDGEQGALRMAGALASEELEDFEDSFLKEVVQVEGLLRLPRPGERLGGGDDRRFEILEALGGGAMGQVFRAWDEELQRLVALKFLRSRRGEAEGLPDLLLRQEARAIAQLDHENIVRLFDVAEWRGARWEPRIPFLVMECLEGESLASLLRRERPELRRTLDILGGVAAGLAHAHARHVIHRDLKPGNVFLTRGGGVKLLDFGLASLLATSSPLIPHVPRAGTPPYMAPEQWRGEAQDERTDLWAAGVMLYELLTGELPYAALSLEELRARVTSADPVPSVGERRPELPRELVRLVAGLLAKEPARRLGSAAELRERLSRLEERLGPWREPPSLLLPQRRQVTLVSCRLEGAEGLAERWDPEDLGEVQAAFHRCCAEAIRRQEGFVALAVGGEVLACFGYPTAREDDSERAVRAGLHLVRALQEELPQRSRLGLHFKVGIHTDAVVFGAGSSIQGEAPRIAASLARRGGPGAVMLSGTTWALVQGAFEAEALPGGEGLEVHRVVRERKSVSRFERTRAAGGLTPWVGRERELQRLWELWERARRGEGSFLLLSGEAGLGKSRLLRELRERVPPGSSHRLLCQCWSQLRDSAFHPLLDMLRRFFRLESEGAAREAHGWEERLASLGLEPEHVRWLGPLFTAPSSGTPTDVLAALEQQRERKQRMLEALRALVLRMAEERPVLLSVEDLHWADPSTLELLGLLLERVGKTRLLVLLSARPECQPAWPPSPGFHRLVLEPLSEEASAVLVRTVARDRELPEEVVRQLVARTDGVPLFVEELTRRVLEEGGTGHLSAIPVSLRELLLARLDALPPRRKALAQLCAVVGRGFDLNLLSHLSARDEASLRREISGLISAGFLLPGPEETGYQFRHVLIQESAYQSLPRQLRRQHHRRIAQALVEHFPDVVEARPELLAHHYTEAGEDELAIHYWERAAEYAIMRSTSAEASSHLRQALALLRGLPDAAERIADEMRLLNALGILLMDLQGYSSEVERLYARTLELFHQLGEALPQLDLLRMGLGGYFIMEAKFELARRLAEQLLAQGRERRDSRLMAQGYRMMASIALNQGRTGRSVEDFERAMSLQRPRERSRWGFTEKLWADERVDDLTLLAVLHTVRGDLREAARCGEEALAQARTMSHPSSLGYALIYLTGASQVLRDVSGALARAEECMALASRMEFQPLVVAAKSLWGWARVRSGESEGLDVLRGSLELQRKLGARALMPYYLGLLVDVHLAAGRVREGLATVDEALREKEETGARFFEAELYRMKGELLRAAGREDEAACSLLRALAVARRQEAALFELRATVALGRQLRDRGGPGQARRRLERILGRFSPEPDFVDLQEARALLAEVESIPRRLQAGASRDESGNGTLSVEE